MTGEVGIDGVSGDDRVEPGHEPVLGSQQTAQTLGFLLSGPECPRHLNGDLGTRQVDGEVRNLGDHE